MAKKPTVTTISSGYYGTTTLNNNFTNIRDQFDNTLSLDGSTPNAMAADLDMDSNDILNVNDAYFTRIYLGGAPLSSSAVTVAAADVTVADVGGYYAGTDVEAVLQDIGANYAVLAQNETVTGNWTFTTPVLVTAATPVVRLDDSDVNGTFDIQQNGATGTISVDPGNVDASSKLTIEVDTAEVVTIDANGHVRFGDGTDPAVTIEAAGTDAMLIPVGTTAQRPTGATGYIRYNSTDGSFEGYNGSAWGSLGGAGFFQGENGDIGTTAAKGDIFRTHEQELNTNVTIAGTDNSLCAGPLTIASGVTLTVSSGGNLVIA